MLLFGCFLNHLKCGKSLWAGGQKHPPPLSGLLSSLSAHRLTGLEESAWGDEEDPDHNYYNSVPGKEPPLGGLVDSRLALTQPCALGGLGQVSLCGLWREGLRPSPTLTPWAPTLALPSSPALPDAGGGSLSTPLPQPAGVWPALSSHFRCDPSLRSAARQAWGKVRGGGRPHT